MSHTHMWKRPLLVAVLASSGAIFAGAQVVHSWGYSGENGPDHWSKFNTTCGLGERQSPIDIVNPQKTALPTISFSYQDSPLAVVNNGHTIQGNYASGSSIVRDGKTYELKQFHFHHHSETAIRGEYTPLEAHLVHQDKDGNYLVVAVLFKEGTANSTIETVWKNIGSEQDKENAPAGVTVNAAQLLPGEHNYYTFRGSLTTPPCSENVAWVVMDHPMTVSKEQIAAFDKLYPNNFRPVQPLNGRMVLESE